MRHAESDFEVDFAILAVIWLILNFMENENFAKLFASRSNYLPNITKIGSRSPWKHIGMYVTSVFLRRVAYALRANLFGFYCMCTLVTLL